MKRQLRALLLSLSFAFALFLPAKAHADPGDEFIVSVLTMGPGDPLFFKFGHIAILVRNLSTGRDAVYNWGMFSFEEPGLITKFAQGRLTYWLDDNFTFRSTLRQYGSENRTLVEQELNLSPAQKLRLVQMVEENARPENRRYRYDYYRDNCSTRVRDVIDRVTDGALHQASTGPATLSYRGETLRMTADTLYGYLLLDHAMGSYIDQPVTLWDQMFVPAKVQRMLREVKVKDQAGQLVPLVRRERLLLSAEREPELESPPNRLLPMLAVGVLLGLVLGGLVWLGLVKKKDGTEAGVGRRLLLTIPMFLLSILTGLVGAIMLFFWVATDHQVAWHNENLLLTSPITLAMPVLAIGIAIGRPWARKAFLRLTDVLLAMAIFALLLKAMPFWFKQSNGLLIAIFLPMWAGIALFARLARRGDRVWTKARTATS